MRYSIASAALAGATAVSALAVPSTPLSRKRDQLVDLSQFTGFKTLDPQEILDSANLTQKTRFDNGEVTDGPSAGTVATADADADSDAKTDATDAAAAGCSSVSVRTEWSSYSTDDRKAFTQAIKCLQGMASGGSAFSGSQSRYEDLASTHRAMTNAVHQTPAFLVWHRYFVATFESLLRDECGFAAPMPWLDETKYAGEFASSDVFSDAWFGHLPPATSSGQGTCITSGVFDGLELHVGPGDSNSDHCLSRAVDESQTAQVSSDFTNSCLSQSTYEDFRNCFELGPHAYGHNGIGSVMADVPSSVGDPIFFVHHLFVDHTFRIWQLADSARLSALDGIANTDTLSSNGLMADMTVGDVLDTTAGPLCYRYDY